jgi:hypothetical protein
MVAADSGEGTMIEGREDSLDRRNQQIRVAVHIPVKTPRHPR